MTTPPLTPLKDGDPCPMEVMRRTRDGAIFEPCGNELPCVHHGTARGLNYSRARASGKKP